MCVSVAIIQSMSGIETDPEVKAAFDAMKNKHQHKWITFKIENKKKIVVCEKGEANRTEKEEDDKIAFQSLIAKFTKHAPIYALYDFGFTNKEGRIIEKLAFIFW